VWNKKLKLADSGKMLQRKCIYRAKWCDHSSHTSDNELLVCVYECIYKFFFQIFQIDCADIPENQNSQQLWVIVIRILIKCLGLESLWQSYWWIFDTIPLPFWNMYLSQANLACVKTFVSDVKKRKERKKKTLYLLLMNPKIISAKSTSVWHGIWIIDVNNLMWYWTQLWLMNILRTD